MNLNSNVGDTTLVVPSEITNWSEVSSVISVTSWLYKYSDPAVTLIVELISVTSPVLLLYLLSVKFKVSIFPTLTFDVK